MGVFVKKINGRLPRCATTMGTRRIVAVLITAGLVQAAFAGVGDSPGEAGFYALSALSGIAIAVLTVRGRERGNLPPRPSSLNGYFGMPDGIVCVFLVWLVWMGADMTTAFAERPTGHTGFGLALAILGGIVTLFIWGTFMRWLFSDEERDPGGDAAA